MNVLKLGVLAALLSCPLACTTNVENPKVDQTGRTGDTTCVQSCDDVDAMCTAKCSDDSCKATCTADLDKCKTSCTTTTSDGG